MATAKKIIKWAQGQIGYKESPANSNKTKYGKWYGLNGRPWCVIFLWAAFYKNKAEKLFYGGKKTAYAPDLYNYYKKHDQTFKDMTKAKAGDIVFFDFNANGMPDHVGFTEKNLGGGYVQTIEGNTSSTNQANGGRVERRKRHKSVILGFARPKYDKPKKTAKKKIDVNKLPVLKSGSKGAAVKKIQKLLKIKADGIYGPETEKAVKKYQEKHKLKADGIVGPKTWKKILK